MPKVIRTRNLISAGEVEIPDQVLPVPMEIPADPEEGAEAPEAQAAPQPDPEQTRRAAEELFRCRLEQMQTQAEETSGKILRHAGEERERILQEARTEAEEIRRQAREEAYQAAVEEKRQRIENLLGATEGLLNQLAQQQRQYFIRYEKALPDLALEIAGKVMEHAIQTDPLVLEPLVQRAVAQVKNAEWLEVQGSQQLPELAQELRKELQEWTDARHVEVTTDQNELGACVVHTPQGIIDASVSTQLDNLNKRLHTPARNWRKGPSIMAERELLDITSLQRTIRLGDLYTRKGKISKIMGLMVEATGLECNMGDICRIQLSEERYALAEVVGILEDTVQLMPYQELDGIGSGSVVINTGRKLEVGITPKMLGRAVDALGSPIDGRDPFPEEEKVWYPINGQPSNPMERPPITEVMELGVRAIDGLLTMGKGQRMGIFAGSGVGKSTLMGMIARNVKADVNVIALVGERGREVVEFIDRDLGPEGMARTVLVVATSDQPAMMRSKCALTATAIAEYFRDQGMDVLLMMDSLTRFCMAQREIGLAAGEPPVARGYTPSIYAALPKLLERSGNFGHGSITGIYTVLVEGDDTNEPISDTVRGIVDGHIVLSRKVAMRNHYPAIDILASISRLMSSIVEPAHRLAAGKVRNMMSVYQQNQDLLLIGAYKSGSNPELDQAIRHMDAINRLLQQSVDTKVSFQETVEQLEKIVE